MNKTLRIVQIAIWSFIAVFATGMLIWCAISGGFSTFGFDFYNAAADTNLTEIQSDIYTDDINNINIQWDDGDVEIFKSGSSETRAVQKAPYGTIKNAMTVELKGDRLIINQNSQRRFFFMSFGNIKSNLELYLPEKLYDSVRIENVSGDTNCGKISAKNLNISIVSGDVYLEGTAQEAHFGNVSGSFRISNLTCPRINVETVSGNAYLSGTFEDITLESVSGGITIESLNMISRLKSNSVSGNLTLNIPDNDGFEFSFDKVSGSFSSDFALTTSGNTYIYKNGSAKLECEVVSGNVNILQNK